MKPLSDLEICKRIAEIEGFESTQCGNVECAENHYIRVSGYADGTKPYNPLTDDALCLNLIDMYAINIKFSGGYILAKCSDYVGDFIKGSCIKRVVCLAIIEANNE